MKLIPKNWANFQHYKDRCPPWIKLHRDLLNDRAFACLPLASKALAPLLWLLASEHKDGIFDGSMEEIVFRLHITPKEYEEGIRPLINKGFFIVASGMLANCLQHAIPETETETETERDTADSRESTNSLRGAKTFRKWIEELKAKSEKPIPEDDPIFSYCESCKLPEDFLRLAWIEFRARYADDAKRYKDWRAVFRRAVREDWFKLWRCDAGEYLLTSKGQQAMQAMRSEVAA